MMVAIPNNNGVGNFEEIVGRVDVFAPCANGFDGNTHGVKGGTNKAVAIAVWINKCVIVGVAEMFFDGSNHCVSLLFVSVRRSNDCQAGA